MHVLLFLKIHIYHFLNNPFFSAWFKAKCKPWFPLPSTQAWPQLMCLVENLWHREPWPSRARMGERRNHSWTICVHPEGSLQHLMPRLKVVFDWWFYYRTYRPKALLLPFPNKSSKRCAVESNPTTYEVGTTSRRSLIFSEGWEQRWEWEQKPKPSHCSWQVHSHCSTAVL